MPFGLRNPTGSHLSESLFRRYERSIGDFTRTYPAAFFLSLSNVKPNSLRVSFRNAVNAFLHNKYPSNFVDYARLAEIWPSVTIVVQDDKIIVQRKGASPGVAAEPLAVGGLVVDRPSPEVFSALCVLHLAGILSLPTTLTNCPSFDVPDGIALDFQPDGVAVLF